MFRFGKKRRLSPRACHEEKNIFKLHMVNDLPVPVWQKTSTVSPRMPRGKKYLQITHGKRLTCSGLTKNPDWPPADDTTKKYLQITHGKRLTCSGLAKNVDCLPAHATRKKISSNYKWETTYLFGFGK